MFTTTMAGRMVSVTTIISKWSLCLCTVLNACLNTQYTQRGQPEAMFGPMNSCVVTYIFASKYKQ